MSWWDDIVELGSDAVDWAVDAGSDVVDWAIDNPTITGAAIGGLAGGGKGALAGAALGYGLSNIAPDTFGGGTFEPTRIGDFFTNTDGTMPEGSYAPRSPVMTSDGGAGTTLTGNLSGATQAGGGVSATDYSLGGTGNAGITGEFGSYGEGLKTAANSADMLGQSATGGGITDTLTGGMRKISDWGSSNPQLASTAIQLGAAALGKKKADAASNAAQQALASQQEAINRNNARADVNNARADVVADTALAQGPEGMARQNMANQARVNNSSSRKAAVSAMSRGLNAQDAANVARRAKIAGAGDENAAYMRGWDTGAANQRAGLSTAKAIQSPYQGLNFDSGAANAVAQSGANDVRGATMLAESLLGDPTAELARRRARSQGVMQ